MENTLGFAHFLAHSDGVARFVLTLMVLMSIGTWYLIVVKTARLIALRRKGQAFLDTFAAAATLDALPASQDDEPYARLVHQGRAALDHLAANGQSRSLAAFGTPGEFLTRALRQVIVQHKSQLDEGQTLLATVASSAPFVGLFGTVWGIYHALLAIGISGQGTLDKVAGPVGEALIMTAIGLAVAIPAAVAYNAFARANRNRLGELDAFASDVYTLLASGSNIVASEVQPGQAGNRADAPLHAVA
jgi:biopolymer transport protein ExbB